MLYRQIMTPSSLLVANRGEIAIRIMRAAAELGIRTVAIFSEDDASSLHTRKADEARPLTWCGRRPPISTSIKSSPSPSRPDCDAIHPGYGFLSENADFAQRCAEEGIRFVGPRPEILKLFGDKVQARVLAERGGIPCCRGTSGPTSLDETRDFFRRWAPALRW